MPDAALGLVTHPLPVKAHVLGQPLRPPIVPVCVISRMHRRAAGEFRWDLDQRLGDQYRNWVRSEP